ncbi:MAG: DUF167 domain-containing protein [Candidatus Hydrogenedentota bacterium]|nr:MAG: DUF167 domain-containing protein [Candidatus Hydrogenedentota bacterium]
MKITVRAHPKSSVRKIVQENDIYHVYIHAPPDKGKANKEIQELLAKHFKVAKKKCVLVKGEKSRNKIFEITM